MSDRSDYILAEHAFQTTDFVANDKEAFWRDEVLSNLGPINVHRLEDFKFDCSVKLKFLSNELLIANTHNGSFHLSRKQKHINTEDQGFFVLGKILQGGFDFKQKDAMFSEHDGGIIFYYASTPFDFIFDNFEDMIIKIPEHLLLGLLPHARDIPAQFFTPQNPYFLLLSQLVNTLYNLPPHTTYLQGIQIRESFLQTLVAALSQHIGTLPELNKLDDYHYQKTMLFLRQHYADETLDTVTIAQAVNLSAGHLQKIFAKMGTSIMQTLWNIRLEKASQQLSLQQMQGFTISDVAFRCGFKSSAHFSRVFRKHTDMSPRDWIARHHKK